MDQINNTTQQSSQSKGYEESKYGFSFGGINARTAPVMFSAKTTPIPGTMVNPAHDQGSMSTQSQNDYLLSVKRRQNFSSFRNRLSGLGSSTRIFPQGPGYHSNSFGEYSSPMGGGNKGSIAPFGGSLSFGQGSQGQFGNASMNSNDRDMNMGMGESMESISSDQNQISRKRGMVNPPTPVSGSGQGFMQNPQESTGMCVFGQQPFGGTFATQNPFSAGANAGNQSTGLFKNSFLTQRPAGGLFGGDSANTQKQPPNTLGQSISDEKSHQQASNIFNSTGSTGTFGFGSSKRQFAFPASGSQRSAFANLQSAGTPQFSSSMMNQQNPPSMYGKPAMEPPAQNLFSQNRQTLQPSVPGGPMSLNQVESQARGNFLFGGDSLSRPQNNNPQVQAPSSTQQPGTSFPSSSQPPFGQNIMTMRNEAQQPASFGSDQPPRQNMVGLRMSNTDTFAPHQNAKRKMTELDAHDAKPLDRQQTNKTQNLFNVADNPDNSTNKHVPPYSNISLPRPATEPSSHAQPPPSGLNMNTDVHEGDSSESRPTPDIMSSDIVLQPAAARNVFHSTQAQFMSQPSAASSALHTAQVQPAPQPSAVKGTLHPTRAQHASQPPAAPDKRAEISLKDDAYTQIKEDAAEAQEGDIKEDAINKGKLSFFESESESLNPPATDFSLGSKDSPHQNSSKPPNEGTASEMSNFSATSIFKPFSDPITNDKISTDTEREQAVPKSNFSEVTSNTSCSSGIDDQRKVPIDGVNKLEEKKPASDVQAPAPDDLDSQDKLSDICSIPPMDPDARKVPTSHDETPQPSILFPSAPLGSAQPLFPASIQPSTFGLQLTSLSKKHHISEPRSDTTPVDQQIGHGHNTDDKPTSETPHPKTLDFEGGKKSMFMGKRKGVFTSNDRGPSKLLHSKAAESAGDLRGSAGVVPLSKPELQMKGGEKEPMPDIASYKAQDSSTVEPENAATSKDKSKISNSSIFATPSVPSGDAKISQNKDSPKKIPAPESEVGPPFGPPVKSNAPSHKTKMPAPKSNVSKKRNREHLEAKSGTSSRYIAGAGSDNGLLDPDSDASRTSKERKVDRDQSFSLLTTKPCSAFSPGSFNTDILKGCPQDLKKDICGVMFKMTVLNKSIVKMVTSYDSKYRLPDYSRSFIDYTSKMISLKERLAKLVSMASPNSAHKTDSSLLFKKKPNHESQILYGTNA